MAEKSTIARPYAEAVFSLAQEQKQLKLWSDMLYFAATVSQVEDMQILIANTNINKKQLADLFIEACKDRLTELGANMIRLLAENRRLGFLPEIAAQFELLRAEAEKTIEAEVVSAYKMSEVQQKDIAAKLKVRLGREVTLTCRVDNSLLGGAIIKAGDLVIDGSTIGQIQKLSIELAR
jgi:F-type H+-transporting ATPase subunit delta